MTPPVEFVLRSAFDMFAIAKFVVVAFVDVELSAVKFWSVDDPVARRLPNEPRPEAVSVVTPVNAPEVTSHELELMSMVSPPSPIVSEPVVVSVPEMLFDPIVPPESVSASDM